MKLLNTLLLFCWDQGIMVRDLKMRKLDYIFKAKNIKTGNVFEVSVEKFTLLTAYPSHGILAFYNTLSMNISKFPVYSDSRVTSVDWIYWRCTEDYILSTPASSAAGSARCHLPAENMLLPLFSVSRVRSALLKAASHPSVKTRENQDNVIKQCAYCHKAGPGLEPVNFCFQLESSFSDSPDFTVLLINIGLKYLARTKFKFPSISLALLIQLSRIAS